jgi:hypothetical protein
LKFLVDDYGIEGVRTAVEEKLGRKLDNLTVPIKPGSFVTHYGNRVHWDGAKDEDVTLLIIGEGPVPTPRVEETS